MSRGCKPRINTSEIPLELSHGIMISSHVKRSLLLWLHNKTRLSPQKKKSFKKNGSEFLMLKNSKVNFVSPRGHVISSMYVYCGCNPRDKLALSLFWDKRKGTTNKQGNKKIRKVV